MKSKLSHQKHKYTEVNNKLTQTIPEMRAEMREIGFDKYFDLMFRRNHAAFLISGADTASLIVTSLMLRIMMEDGQHSLTA